jgi:dihydroorotate dehydrogenase electron transfer subunit
MLELAKQLTCTKEIVLGYRDITFLDNEFYPYGEVYISTEDGNTGTKGNVIDAIKENKLTADIIYACARHRCLRY